MFDVTWDNWGRLQLTGTRMVLEFDPEEVEEALRVTAMALAFPSLPPEPWSPSNRRPITGVCDNHTKTAIGLISIRYIYSILLDLGIKERCVLYEYIWHVNELKSSFFLTSEMSKVKSRVFPGRALAEPSHTLLTSKLERSPCVWLYAGCTKLAERDTTNFKMFKASFQCTVCKRDTSNGV